MAVLAKAKRANNTPAVPFVDPKTHTLVDLDIGH
jgi:hypothetical protein